MCAPVFGMPLQRVIQRCCGFGDFSLGQLNLSDGGQALSLRRVGAFTLARGEHCLAQIALLNEEFRRFAEKRRLAVVVRRSFCFFKQSINFLVERNIEPCARLILLTASGGQYGQ